MLEVKALSKSYRGLPAIDRVSFCVRAGEIVGYVGPNGSGKSTTIKMLTGNKGKYLGIILGIAFASLLIAQQASIFCGLMLQTCGQVFDIKGADIRMMDKNVRFIDDIKTLQDNDLYRVRGVPGVAWAVKFFKGLTRSRLENGMFQQTILLGLDDTGAHILQAVLFALGVFVMVAFIRAAQRVEPFTRRA